MPEGVNEEPLFRYHYGRSTFTLEVNWSKMTPPTPMPPPVKKPATSRRGNRRKRASARKQKLTPIFVPASHKDEKICVVAVVGKSRINTCTSKASLLNPILDADVFKGVEVLLKDSVSQGSIECYYDTDSNVVYLHHTCLHDTLRLTSACHQLTNLGHKDFQSLWPQEDAHHAKSLLLLFLISHIIVISHPGSSFDISYIRLFRTLDSIRLKLQKCVSEQLLGFPISKDWVLSGRPCSPRVLFVFEMSTIEYVPEETDAPQPSAYRPRNPKISPLRRLHHSVEDQIYKLLRKSRVITNISNNSLFAVPANQEFVYINVHQNEAADPVTYLLQQLRANSGTRDSETDVNRSRSYQTNRRTIAGPSTGQRSPGLSISGGENSFKEFLWQHIDTALTKGFDDNVGRHPVTATFEASRRSGGKPDRRQSRTSTQGSGPCREKSRRSI